MEKALVVERQGRILIAGLRDEVSVSRDERGIPFIEASQEEDLYFAQGYVAASDRLWQMDLLRRTGRGELAEIFGRRSLREDQARRAFGFGALAEQMVARLSPQTRHAFDAYALGVNAYIESRTEETLPEEFRILKYRPQAWHTSDSLVLGKIFAESLTTNWQEDIMRSTLASLPRNTRDLLMPDTSPLDVILVGSDGQDKKSSRSRLSRGRVFRQHTTSAILEEAVELIATARTSLERVGLHAEMLAASNSWVVSGKWTATGKPLLANDPHLAPSCPSIWYMTQLKSPGLHVAGVTVAGVPGILIGHNEWIAWGITNVGGDGQDLYLEEFQKGNPRRYRAEGGLLDAEIRREQILVRKSFSSPETETVQHEVTLTRHGPITIEKDDLRYALRWASLDATSVEFEAYYWIDRARNWQEFRGALNRYTGFPLNYTYADIDGSIGFCAAGRFPIRRTGQGTVPYDGTSDQGEWIGYVPFDATPQTYNPPGGIIVTANNRTVGSTYPYYITHSWSAPYRARRIYDLLMTKRALTVDDFRSIQSDVYSIPESVFIAEVLKLAQPLAATSSEWKEISTIFNHWDAKMSAESQTMPIAFTMRNVFRRRILVGAVGARLADGYKWPNSGTFIDQVIERRQLEWLPTEFHSYEAFLVTCYKEALERLTDSLGPERSMWTWGRLEEARFPHPLEASGAGKRFAIAPFQYDGGETTINRGSYVSMRFIADLSDWDNTRMGIPLGESGQPASPHWSDQLADWQNVSPGVFRFNEASAAGAAREVLILAPDHVRAS